ncbi:MAG: aminotransferase class III-fold pyridoxal phosphate-dependent enzyme [Thermoplasmatota archaeon]
MQLSNMYEALINDRVKYPERTSATLERVLEVVRNVLDGDEAEHVTYDIQGALRNTPGRKPLSGDEARKIIRSMDISGIDPGKMDRIADQLMLSELSTEEVLQLHEDYKIPVSRLETDILPVKGDGCWIMDSKGDWYLDLDSNYSASNLGMANREIAIGLKNQAEQLISMKEDRVQVARARFLKEIEPMMPDGLDYFYWQNSGGEAVDKSLKIAKAYTKSKDVIAFKNGFHGRTHGAVAVTYNEKYRKPFFLHEEEWVHFADFNDISSVGSLLDETKAKIIIMEMVQGEEAGNLPATQEFIDSLWKLAREKNVVIIDDEVQAGFGRTAVKSGDWFACDSYNVVPDIMVIGKSFGGGYPVTAVVTNEKIKNGMVPGYDGSTFGGNPMAMTAALIATRQMRRKDITTNVVERASQMEEGLKEIFRQYRVVEGFRNRGLMISIDLGKEENVTRMQDGLRKRGIKTSLSTGRYIRFLPPTIISAGEVDLVLRTLKETLDDL